MRVCVLLLSITIAAITACGTLVAIPQDQPTVPTATTPEASDNREPATRTFEWPGKPAPPTDAQAQLASLGFDGIPIGVSVQVQQSLAEVATAYQTTPDKLLIYNPTLSDPVLPGTF